MSYSYIKTVFPTFENTISFNTNTFNDLNSQVKVEQKPLNVSGLEPTVDSTSLLKNNEEKFFLTQQTLLEDFKNTQNTKQKVVKTQLQPQQSIQDNLHYYNTPLRITEAMTNEQQQQLPQTQQPQTQQPQTQQLPQTIQQPVPQTQQQAPPQQIQVNQPTSVSYIPTGISKTPVALHNTGVCTQSYNHIMECAQCKEMLYKNFNFENKKNDYKEEIFELISYCIFAIFILFLLEKLHK